MPPAVHGHDRRLYMLPTRHGGLIKENKDHQGSKCTKTGHMSTQKVSSMTSTQQAAAKTSINVTFTN